MGDRDTRLTRFRRISGLGMVGAAMVHIGACAIEPNGGRPTATGDNSQIAQSEEPSTEQPINRPQELTPHLRKALAEVVGFEPIGALLMGAESQQAALAVDAHEYVAADQYQEFPTEEPIDRPQELTPDLRKAFAEVVGFEPIGALLKGAEGQQAALAVDAHEYGAASPAWVSACCKCRRNGASGRQYIDSGVIRCISC